jgi:hypothetical protein
MPFKYKPGSLTKRPQISALPFDLKYDIICFIKLLAQVDDSLSSYTSLVQKENPGFMEIKEHISKPWSRRRSSSPSHFQEKWTLGNLHSEKEFSAIVKREQKRANRSNSLFSLVAFSVGDTDRDRSITYRLVKVLNKRLRLIDEVGWLETGLLGVLLPGTQAKDAQRFAEDIGRKISDRKLHSFFKSYTYPSERLPGSKR